MFSDCDRIIEDPDEEERGSDGTPDRTRPARAIFHHSLIPITGAANHHISANDLTTDRLDLKRGLNYVVPYFNATQSDDL